jgi:hypothetical protein
MNGSASKFADLKQKARHELIEYAFNVIYLTAVFATFTTYRRLMLAAHDVTYTNYGFALIEALILGKVIMIGGVFHLGRGLEDRPLIYPTLCKTAVFTIFCFAFTLAEHAIKGFVSGRGAVAGLGQYAAQGHEVILANSMVVFVALIPFFAVKELGRVMGRDEVGRLFFRPRSAA